MQPTPSCNNPRLLSPPIQFLWAGWRATSIDLAAAGWQIAVDEDLYTLAFHISIHHASHALTGLGSVSMGIMRGSRDPHRKIPPVVIKLAPLIDVNSHSDNTMSFRVVDMTTPRWTTEEQPGSDILRAEYKSIMDYWVPASLDPGTTKEILLDQISLDEVLAIATEKQEPAQQKIRKRLLRDKAMKGLLDKGQAPSKIHTVLRVA